jgi:hypothetical protein
MIVDIPEVLLFAEELPPPQDTVSAAIAAVTTNSLSLNMLVSPCASAGNSASAVRPEWLLNKGDKAGTLFADGRYEIEGE